MESPRRHVRGQGQAGVAQLVEHLICNQAKTALNSFIPNIFIFWVDVWVDGDASFAEFWEDVEREMEPGTRIELVTSRLQI